MDANTIALFTLGGIVASATAYSFWANQRRNAARSKSEGDLDGRVYKMMEMVTAPLNTIIDEERAEKKRAQDRAIELMDKFLLYTESVEKRHADNLRDIRIENKADNQMRDAAFKETTDRLHNRVDKCEEKHRADEETIKLLSTGIEQVKGELREVRASEREWLRAMPSVQQQQTPVVVQVPQNTTPST